MRGGDVAGGRCMFFRVLHSPPVRGLWLIVVSLGCAAAPAANRPSAPRAEPSRSSSPRTTVAAQPGDDLVRDRATFVSTVPTTQPAPQSQLEDPDAPDVFLPLTFASTAEAASKGSCGRVRAASALALVAVEADLVNRLRLARDLLDDAAPEAEQRATLWRDYDQAVAEFETAHRRTIRPYIAKDILTQKSVRFLLELAFEQRWGETLPYESAAWHKQVALLARHAEFEIEALIDDVTRRCTGDVIAESKGRWVAILNGKL
jgi:hypothetical protein